MNESPDPLVPGASPVPDPEAGDSPYAEFWIEEESEETGRIRLGLVGELDVAGADHLQDPPAQEEARDRSREDRTPASCPPEKCPAPVTG